MVNPADVSACVVTRGDVDLDPVLRPLLHLGEVLVWDNSQRENLSVYGRYALIQECTHDVILVQDDDCVLAPESVDELLAAYRPGHVVCNMPERFRPHYPDSALVGFGAVFDRDLPEKAFTQFSHERWSRKLGWSFYRECDTVFTMLTPRILIDVDVEILPAAHEPHRLWKQRGHFEERERMRKLVRQVRDAV